MNNSLKTLGIGFLGGMIPLGFGFYVNKISNNKPSKNKSETEQIVQNNRRPLSILAPETINFVTASDKSINSVVHVTTKVERTQVQRDPFYELFYGPGSGNREFKQYGSGSGSGVIVSKDGYIVTNNHVIEDASEIEVILNDNSSYSAKIIGTDPSTDLAVLKIEGQEFDAIEFGNSDDVRVGEWVLAVGNPFNLTSTVTAGIVSAKARNINLLKEKNTSQNVPIESFIQTDAAVNPGNSGGALVNTLGELVGINTAIASQTGSYAGYSFAIPVNLVKKVMTDIIDFGIVQRGYLGVQIADITQELKEKNSLPDLKGVFVSAVNENGAADKVGIKKDWVILKAGGIEVNSVSELQEQIGKKRPGDKISLVCRNESGEEVTKEVVVRNLDGETELKSKAEMSKTSALGATFEELTSKEKKEFGIENGVKIKNLDIGKLKSAGLSEGTVITSINEKPVESVEQITNFLNTKKGGIYLDVIYPNGRKDYKAFGN